MNFVGSDLGQAYQGDLEGLEVDCFGGGVEFLYDEAEWDFLVAGQDCWFWETRIEGDGGSILGCGGCGVFSHAEDAFAFGFYGLAVDVWAESMSLSSIDLGTS